MSVVALPARLQDHTEPLKWVALAAMTFDHINTFLLAGSVPALYALGRIAFPLFALVLASNLARPSAHYGRLSARLVGFGLLAALPLTVMGHAMPLNVMFTFAAAVLVIALRDAGWLKSGAVAFVLLGIVVDYHWPGLLLIVAARRYFATKGTGSMLVTLGALVALAWPNENYWALAAVPVILAVQHAQIDVPRLRWAFYAYYPLHFAVLALLAK